LSSPTRCHLRPGLRAAAARVRSASRAHAVRGPHVEGEPRPGYLSRPLPLGSSTRAPDAKPERRRNPNSSSPPPPSISAVAAASLPRSCPRAAPGGELCTRVARRRPRAPRRLGAVAGVPVLRRRDARPHRRVSTATAALGCLAASRASRRRSPQGEPIALARFGLAPARSPPGAATARSPPALHRRPPLACDLGRRIQIRRPRLISPPASHRSPWILIQRV
jgi:hypothetical protein